MSLVRSVYRRLGCPRLPIFLCYLWTIIFLFLKVKYAPLIEVYLLKKYDHKTLTIHDHSDIWERQFIEISGVTLQKNIVIGNIYRPPKDLINNYRNFKEQLIPVFEHLHSTNLEAVIAGDMNIDQLKINERNIFTEYFSPCITLPTRFSKRSATLIDNFLLKFSEKYNNTSAGILSSAISEHLPYFVSQNKKFQKRINKKY